MSRKTLFLLLSLFTFHCLFFTSSAQDTIHISLEQAIEQSAYSVEAMLAKNEYEKSYWQYRTYKAELLPEVVFSGTLPYYSKSYNQFQNSDGSYNYVSNDYARFDAGLFVNQNIPLTGGRLSIGTNLQRLDQLGNNPSRNYMGSPVALKLEQPIGGINLVKWMQKIEPVRYQEAKARLVSALENVTTITINHYFNLLLAQINWDIAQQNYHNTVKLYEVATAKRSIGKISENDMLQLKLGLLKAESYLTDAQAERKTQQFKLRTFLGYNDRVVLHPQMPQSLSKSKLQLHYPEVLALAVENSSFTQNIRRRQLEAARSLSQAKADRRQISLVATFGLSGQGVDLPAAYNHPINSQVVSLGVNIPLLDWGRRRGQVKIAESNKKLVQSETEREQLEFDQDIFMKVENFNNQFKQVGIAEESDQIAQIRYKTSIEAFILGSIDVLNLNDAQLSKDGARRSYIEQMYRLWAYYSQIRGITLYDFVKDVPIYADFDAMK